MEFKKYQHLERFGNTEVQLIEIGECYVFPKIDGTNASVWIDKNGDLQAGSRTRHLSLEKDNAGFLDWACQQENLLEYLKENPTHRLFGEWLVPHSLKTYKDSAWRQFYVFDVMVEDEYLHYEVYKRSLEIHNVNYIPPICTATNASYDQFINQLEKNVFLIEDGKGVGEGVVIKNYSYKNKFGRNNFAKIVTSEFKEKHAKTMGGHDVKGKKMVEEEIANEFVTIALCEKVHAKIELDGGFGSKDIPKLLNMVYYDLIKEESWEFIKKHKNPTINFNTLKHFTFIKVKESLPNLF